LSANGGVWLFSPAGIIFGPGRAVVNTGSFLASTGIFQRHLGKARPLNGNLIQISRARAHRGPGLDHGGTPRPGASPAASINAPAPASILLHSPNHHPGRRRPPQRRGGLQRRRDYRERG